MKKWKLPVVRGATAWGAGVALGVAGLLVQVFAWQSETWTRNSGLRGVYVAACAVFGCELPVLRFVPDIAVQDLVLRSGPDAGAPVVVEAVLRNEASFAQPFPALEVRLSNLTGQVVVAQRFGPREYLGESFAPGARIPVMTPVPVALEIRDPPVEAVNAVVVPR